MTYWLVKDHYKGKVYLRTNSKEIAVNYANYYNSIKKVPFTKYKISNAYSIVFNMYSVDINSQFGSSKGISLYPTHFKSPFVKNNLKYQSQHKKYLEMKYKLVVELCRKYHLWPYCERDGHKLCGFDW